MNRPHLLKLVLAVSVPCLVIFLLLLFILLHRKRPCSSSGSNCEEAENEKGSSKGGCNDEEAQLAEDLLSYGTLYKASLQGGNGGSVRLLRFLRPVCVVGEVEEFGDAIRFLGGVRHQNLVPLLGFYGGRRGEKLLVHPFYRRGNLADFIRDNGEPLKPSVIYRISTGIARGLDHLHTGLQRPLINGNMKSKNVFLDRNWEPCISDSGLHLLLNSASGQQMLEALSTEGYKAPELMKMKEVNEKRYFWPRVSVSTQIFCSRGKSYPNPLHKSQAYAIVKQTFVSTDDFVSQKIVVQKDSPRGTHFRPCLVQEKRCISHQRKFVLAL
ncbi:hypothetical protein MLD38_008927 [Melastoma candidum]|uniref:Uncharacterized protein n=1 Tax=Melastoma candidum TaxID=119954 RepID=A0ACB9RZ02_9MYRT|nr:hypothetical protein MLD38_008927 [Melastoma candidum]